MSPIVLLGFDMRLVSGRSHFHGDYKAPDPGIYQYFVGSFAGWDDAVRAAGATVVNATPSSALHEFPIINLDEFLQQTGSPS